MCFPFASPKIAPPEAAAHASASCWSHVPPAARSGPTGGDAGNQEKGTFDYCGGHADPSGVWHTHMNNYCLEINAPKPNSSSKHSPMIGWAPDGTCFCLSTQADSRGSLPTEA